MNIHELDTYLRNLTPHQFKIIQVVYNAEGEWLTRAMVAKRLGKKRLTPYDIECLIMLSEKNILQASTQPTTAPGSDFAYIYTMPDEIAGLIQEWTQRQEQNNSPKSRKPLNLVDDD